MAEEKKVEKKARKDYLKWFREMRSELKKIVWPSAEKTAKDTGTVLLCSLAVGVVIWIFDAVAMNVVQFIIKLFAA